MKRKYLIEKAGNKRLVLFFTGWSTDWRILKDISLPEGYDLLCLWNYEDDTWESLEHQYEEVVIIAWSFGVPVANKLFSFINKDNNITGLFAVNGTVFPVDDEKGIPTIIFYNTFNSLDERNLYKFRIRISGGLKRFKNFESNFPANDDILSLKRELTYFKDKSYKCGENPVWDYAIISDSDKIFPLENLKRGWDNTPSMVMEDQEHLPNFQTIIDFLIKDKQSVVRKFEKTLYSYEDNAIVQKELAEKILFLLKKTDKTFENILEIGGGSGMLTRNIKDSFPDSYLMSLDIVKGCQCPGVEIYEGDAETVMKNLLANSFDLVISGSTFQWFHSPYRCLTEVFRVIKEKGIFAFTTYLPGTFKELSDLSGHGLLYLKSEEWENILKKVGFEMVTIKKKSITLYFDKVSDIFSHLRSTGVNGLAGRNKKISEMKEMMRNYPLINGKYPLSYETLLMIVRK